MLPSKQMTDIQPKPIRHHVYFRHGPRLNLNLDPPLKSNVNQQVKDVGLKISAEYGTPKSIITSPYIRTRQTAQIFSKLFTPPIKLMVDSRLSEKLSIRKRTGRGPPGEYDPMTASYPNLPKLGETDLEVKTRLSQHLADFSTNLDETWFVTHGYILQALVELYGSKVPFPPPSLSALVIPRMNFNQIGFWFRLHYPKHTYIYQRQSNGRYQITKTEI